MIPVRNIYHMLAYAFHKLKDGVYVRCATEDFDNAVELLASILDKGIAIQLKRGLERDYRGITESTKSIRGKIHLSDSIRSQSPRRQELFCAYDVFDENSYRNRILKTTVNLLLRQSIKPALKQSLRKMMFFFRDIDELPLNQINWQLQYNRNNQSYQLLIGICHLIIKGLLQTETDGSVTIRSFLDEQSTCRLYEKFILNYFLREHPELRTTSEQIPWAMSGERNPLLPIMQSDVVLRSGNRTLIIDAKYYRNNLQSRYKESYKIHSNNLYQIYTYVDNYSKLHPGEEVSGMLLYARTDAQLQPDAVLPLHRVPISVRTLDLNLEFRDIAAQLDDIAATLKTSRAANHDDMLQP